jgi:acetyl-CoA carboxylase carboxyl transferase subunit alpha
MMGMQGEAIAYNLREMFGLEVPIITTVIGEGGSGGALAIGCANHRFVMQNAVFYVASPEACASILWKDRSKVNLVRCLLSFHALLACVSV